MICPNCNKKVELTNKRYFKSLLGRHICPYCLIEFKLKRTKIYFIWIFFLIILVSSSLFFILNYIVDKTELDIFFGIFLVVLFFFSSYIDRKIENGLSTIKIK